MSPLSDTTRRAWSSSVVACWTECAVEYVPVPATTFARSPTASIAAAKRPRRSSSLRVGASPVVPATTTPSEPFSTRCKQRRLNESRLTEPSSANGVTTAVRICPSTRLILLQQPVEPHGDTGRKARELLEGEEDARDERLPGRRVVANGQELSEPAQEDLLMRHQPWKTHGVDRYVSSHRLRRRLGRSGRRVDLALVVQLYDLRMRQVREGLGREAHHEHRAHCEVRSDEARDPLLARDEVESCDVIGAESRRPHDARYPCAERSLDVRAHGIGTGEVDGGGVVVVRRCAGLVDGRDGVPCLLEPRSQHGPDLAGRSEQENPHAAAAATRPGQTGSTAARSRSSFGPIAAAERRSRASRRSANSATPEISTASISARMRSSERSSLSVMRDFPSRLIRFEVSSMDSMIRPLRFSFARVTSSSLTSPADTLAICSERISRHSRRFSSRVPT